MRRVVLLLLAGVPTVAAAQHPLEITSNAAILVDIGTTLHNLRASPIFTESNPLMPLRPTTGTVLFWGSVAVAANEGLTRFLLPPKGRPYVWAFVTLIETTAIVHNTRRITVHVAF